MLSPTIVLECWKLIFCLYYWFQKIIRYISGIICTLKFCTLETSRDILSHLWSLNMRKSCYKTCFPRSCKIVKERNPFKFFYHIYAITRLSTSQQQAKARQKFTKIILFKLKWYIFLIIVIFPPNTVHVRRQTLWFWRWYLTLRGEHDYLYFVSFFFFQMRYFINLWSFVDQRIVLLSIWK